MARALFIAAHRTNRSPSQRFRFEQYFDLLEQNGFKCHFSYLISEHDDRIFYQKGKTFWKSLLVLKYIWKRLKDVMSASKYDIIFIQREAFMLGTTIFEKLLSRSKAKTIFDFDDSIWFLDVSKGNWKWRWLKSPDKTKNIIALSDMVFAGNNYLAAFAKSYNDNVKIIPTTIDTNEYKRVNIEKTKDKICIGWTGSITTIKHFQYALTFLEVIKKKYKEKVYFKVIGDNTYQNNKMGITGLPWIKEDEIKELSEFDIGIMPLPDDKWAKGKCGLKGLQYMALEIPTVMSPVGVNTEIINEGVNGFLSDTDKEWIEKISLLIESEELRKRLGKAGRQTVIEKYSVDSQKQNYLNYFKELLQE